MGCKFCKSISTQNIFFNKGQQQPETKKEYSWDKKEKVNPKDFTIENQKGETCIGRLPGTINGQQFIIQNCESTNVYLLDHINTVTIDDCVNCNLVVGPTKGSVFIRNCKDCRLIVACQQFRTRDCQRLDVFLYSKTHPIIESSNQIKFGCYVYSYPELENQFLSSGLSVFNNDWSNVHDFTPLEGDTNWTVLTKNCRLEDYVPVPSSQDFSEVAVTYALKDSVVPYTSGIRRKVSTESCIVVFFWDGHSHSRGRSFMNEMRVKYPSIVLARTKEMKMTALDANKMFHTDSYSSVVERGLVIGMEYNGDDSIQACQKVATETATTTGSTSLLYVASDAKSASDQIKEFFDLADMQMSL